MRTWIVCAIALAAIAGSMLAFDLGTLTACGSPPCDLPNAYAARGGHKTVAIDIDGTATAEVQCRVESGMPYVTVGSGTSTDAIVETDAWCDSLEVVVTALTTGTVHAVVKSTGR